MFPRLNYLSINSRDTTGHLVQICHGAVERAFALIFGRCLGFINIPPACNLLSTPGRVLARYLGIDFMYTHVRAMELVVNRSKIGRLVRRDDSQFYKVTVIKLI